MNRKQHNQSSDPTPSSGTSPARQEPRLPYGGSPQRQTSNSQVFRAQTSVPGYPRKHLRPDFVTVLKSKYVVGLTFAFEDLVRTALSLNSPADSEQCGQNEFRFSGTPYAHAGTENTSLI